MKFLSNNKFIEITLEQKYPSRKCKTINDYKRMCLDVLQISNNGDTLIFWYDFMGVVCWWICLFTFRKRKIIILNLLLKEKNTTKNKIARFLYKIPLNSNKVEATVTSVSYGKWINDLLKIDKEYFLLHDIYLSSYELNRKNENLGVSDKFLVFCGGRNGRNWELFFEIAKSNKNYNFIAVMPKDDYIIYKKYESLKNVKIKYDISLREYQHIMLSSNVVIMPLNTEAPAGLIALFQAAANCIPVIATQTVTTEEYLSNENGFLAKNTLKEWNSELKKCHDEYKKAIDRAIKFKSFLSENCSEKVYAKRLEMLVKGE